jgi:phenol hydroxylase P5 protein
MTVHRVRVDPAQWTVRCAEDQTVLDACLRHSVPMPHACLRGSCGRCRADLLEGTVEYVDVHSNQRITAGEAAGTALTESEVRDGRVLLCAVHPTSDLIVAVPEFEDDGSVVHPVRDFAGFVVCVEDCSPDIRRIILDLDQPLDFCAGQYITVRVPDLNLRRSYSLANAPADRRRIELHIRRAPGGAATDGWLWRSLCPGDRVDISGPFGRFRFRDDATTPAILVGGDTGLAPLKSMVQDVLARAPQRQLHLYHGTRSRADEYERDFFSWLTAEHPDRFTYTPFLAHQTWSGVRATLMGLLLTEHPHLRGYHAYVSGPMALVEEATGALIARRVATRDIAREVYYERSGSAQRAGRAAQAAAEKAKPGVAPVPSSGTVPAVARRGS